MPFDADDAEIEYLDYLAEHESGFLCDDPPDVVGTEEYLRLLVLGTGTAHRIVRAQPVKVSRGD